MFIMTLIKFIVSLMLATIHLWFMGIHINIGNPFATMPTDQELERRLIDNQATFNRLLEMTQHDKNMDRIAPTFTRTTTNWAWPRPESELGISKQRWDEYKVLFKELHIADGIQRETIQQQDCIFFFVYSGGFTFGGNSKGYVHCTAPLSSKNGYQFKKLTSYWYLYQENH